MVHNGVYMRTSKKIALCGLSAAIGSLFLSFVLIAPTIKLSLFVLASVAVMLPLSKKLYGGAFLTMLATSFIGFITGGLLVFLPYILVFGIHPIINALLEKIKITKFDMVIKIAIKLVYFIGILFLLFKLAYIADLFLIELQFYILALIVGLAFIPYDILMQTIQKRVNYFFEKNIKM